MHLSSGAMGLFKLLHSFARRSGRAFPFQKTLACRLHVSEQMVRRWLLELKTLQAVEVVKRQHSSAEYRLLKTVEKLRSELRSELRSGAVHKGMSTDSELELAARSRPELAFPEPTITNEYGRTDPNPEFEHLQRVLRGAQERVRRARNPVAYERAIIQAELRALRRPVASETASYWSQRTVLGTK